MVVIDVSLQEGGDVDRVIARISGMPLAERRSCSPGSNPEATRSLTSSRPDPDRAPQAVNLSQLVDVVRSCVRSFRKARWRILPDATPCSLES